ELAVRVPLQHPLLQEAAERVVGPVTRLHIPIGARPRERCTTAKHQGQRKHDNPAHVLLQISFYTPLWNIREPSQLARHLNLRPRIGPIRPRLATAILALSALACKFLGRFYERISACPPD